MGESATTLYLVRHGEVHNPEGVIYGRLPGYGLSERGRRQIEAAAQALAPRGPFAALYASPLQRARESAAILGARFGLEAATDERIVETGIGAFRARARKAAPRPSASSSGG